MAKNSSRALEQVVSVDGWIGEFSELGVATVHADVVFREGHFGAASDDKVRFRVSLKRAEIVLCVPSDDELKIVRSSIARTPEPAEQTRKTKRETTLEGELAAGIGLDETLVPTANLKAQGGAKTTQTTIEEAKEALVDFMEQHFNTLDGHPAWEVQRRDGKPMNGAPWNANEKPRLDVRRKSLGEQPFLRIEIRCRRQDLHIDGLELKDAGKQRGLLNRPNFEKNLAAAEQIIKEELVKAGFIDLSNVNEDHSELLVADVVITED